MKQIILTQNKVALVDDEDFEQKAKELFGEFANLKVTIYELDQR